MMSVMTKLCISKVDIKVIIYHKMCIRDSTNSATCTRRYRVSFLKTNVWLKVLFLRAMITAEEDLSLRPRVLQIIPRYFYSGYKDGRKDDPL